MICILPQYNQFRLEQYPSSGSFKQFLVVQDPDGFSDRQDPGILEFSPVRHTSPTNGNVEAPRAIDPVFHTYPPSRTADGKVLFAVIG